MTQRKTFLREKAFHKFKNNRVSLSSLEVDLINKFIHRLPHVLLEKAARLHDLCGGSMIDVVILQEDQDDAQKQQLIDDVYSGALLELYQPFLDLSASSKRNLIDARNEVFLNWLFEAYEPYLDERISYWINAEMAEAGLLIKAKGKPVSEDAEKWAKAKADAFRQCQQYLKEHPGRKTAPMPVIREIVKQYWPETLEDKRKQDSIANKLRTTTTRKSNLRAKRRSIRLYK